MCTFINPAEKIAECGAQNQAAANASRQSSPKQTAMRMRLVLPILSVLLGCTSALAQLPVGGAAAARTGEQQPALDLAQQQPFGAFAGSGIVDKPVPGSIPISLLNAIDRGIKHNLGLLLSQEQTERAKAQHWRSLSALLPNVSVHASESVEKINLAAFGVPIFVNGSTLVGPFGIFDARGTVSETLLDVSALNRLRSTTENEKAAKFTLQDARELVVLVTGDQYLLTLADAARLDTAKAQLVTAQAILQRTEDRKAVGAVAGLDVLRAKVQMQQIQQRVLVAENQLERQKLSLARTIGLPISQEFQLTDAVPYGPLPPLDVEAALERAYARRPEYLAAESRTRAAELAVKAAQGERLPSLSVDGDYGILGRSVGDGQPTYSVAAGIRIPVFQGGRIKADMAQAQSDLRERRLELADLRSRIEFEVRTAWLDAKTSMEQVEVAKQSTELAAEQLKQAQDRYAAGLSGTLDVVQAQEAVASANETYIQALYQNNVAKLTLARALGVAEQQTRAFFGGK
ncbi:MAG TPA: TolC family protein [Candidatus Angelobacter sp.]|nr:TolC family protein [Candidatus Angelobacter sp.]